MNGYLPFTIIKCLLNFGNIHLQIHVSSKEALDLVADGTWKPLFNKSKIMVRKEWFDKVTKRYSRNIKLYIKKLFHGFVVGYWDKIAHLRGSSSIQTCQEVGEAVTALRGMVPIQIFVMPSARETPEVF